LFSGDAKRIVLQPPVLKWKKGSPVTGAALVLIFTEDD